MMSMILLSTTPALWVELSYAMNQATGSGGLDYAMHNDGGGGPSGSNASY